MKPIESTTPPLPAPLRAYSNTPIWKALKKRDVGEWIKVDEYETRDKARAKQGNLLSLVSRNRPLGRAYGIKTAYRQEPDGMWILSVCKIARYMK